MRNLLLASVMVPLLVAAPASARAGEAEKKAVIDLMHLILPPESYRAMLDQVQTQMVAAMAQQGQRVPAEALPKLRAAVEDAAPYDELIAWTADIYAARFTLSEIRDLTAFYKTPTGRKAARLLPELGGEVGKKMGEMLPQRLPAALKKHGLQ